MRLTRVYHSGRLEGELQLDFVSSHHLAKVLRMRVNDECIVFDGLGSEAQYRIVAINKKVIELIKISDRENALESTVNIHLCQAIAKGDKMDWIIQKSVELGVTEITPMFTERSDVRLDAARLEKKVAHWQSIIVSACQQSGRAVLPKLSFPGISFSELLVQDGLAEKRILFSPKADISLRSVSEEKNYLIAIGPEGGFSDQEVQSALRSGFLDFSLGKRILRTETAAVSAVANLQLMFDK